MRFLPLLIGLVAISPACAAPPVDPDYRTAIEADWHQQEQRAGRHAGSIESIRAALDHGQKLLASLASLPNCPDLSTFKTQMAEIDQAATAGAMDDAARLALYHRLRWLARDMAMQNPLLAGRPLIFLERRRFICQMLHEYLAYYYDNISGGGVYLLENPGNSFATRCLARDRLPAGNYTTLSLSYDAKTIYFAFAPSAAPKPDFYHPAPECRYFHLFAIDADGHNLRQLTTGPWDDFDPCPLPDGGIAFISSRRGGGFIRCNNPWEPLPACTLHRMDADGRNIRTLSFHETNEWHPGVLNDGRIVYTRWDYVDRSAANFHGLWVSNSDGANPAAIFGNYTMRINACYQPHAVPNSRKILFVAGAHHADVGGSLVMLDPLRASLDPATGEDRLDSIEKLTPEVCFPEAQGWPQSFFHGPWPLSEDFFLAGFSYDKLPGMSSGNAKDAQTGLYYLDRFGNMELLYRDAGISCMYPIPLAPRPVPPETNTRLYADMRDEAELILTDVRQSLMPLPANRPIKQLRIFQVLPKTTHIVNVPRIGHANAEGARMLLGTVPVEADGSAYFRVPARKPIYFQAIDANGHAVQTMRSITYLQPGERRGCVGCHESANASTAPARQMLALGRGPSRIEPGPDGSRPFSFPRLIQPLLDSQCTRCHGGTAPQPKPDLTGQPSAKTPFTRSYDNLKPYLRWYEWGKASISQIASQPGHAGADQSPLLATLSNATHRDAVHLTPDDVQRLCIWLDGNVPFYGVYDGPSQAAQRQGQAVAEPAAQ